MLITAILFFKCSFILLLDMTSPKKFYLPKYAFVYMRLAKPLSSKLPKTSSHTLPGGLPDITAIPSIEMSVLLVCSSSMEIILHYMLEAKAISDSHNNLKQILHIKTDNLKKRKLKGKK